MMVRETHELPCPMPCCGVLTRVELFEDVSDHGPLLTVACPACVEALEAERSEEEAIEDYDREHREWWL